MNIALSKKRSAAALALSVATVLTAGCSSDDDVVVAPPESLTAALPGLGLNTLASLLVDAGLDDDLAAPGALTLFAPTDAAFAALEPATLAALQADMTLLEDALQYHVVMGDVPSTTALGLTSAGALNGDTLGIDAVNGGLYINDARVASADNVTGNGRIHIIDRVLLPPAANLSTALGERGFNNLIAAVGASSLTPDGTALTVFAPTDQAFEDFAVANGSADFATFLAGALQADVDALLQNHLLAGTGNTLSALLAAGDAASVGGPLLFAADSLTTAPTVNGITLTGFNAPATDALIHTVGEVIEDPGTVVDVATAAGLTTLVTNVTNAGLAATLSGPGPFTVFAPNETAWMDPALANLQMAGNEAALSTVLQYHVVGNAIQSGELAQLPSVTTLEGSNVQIVVDANGNISLETNPGMTDNVLSNVELADVLSNNAVVHVIDEVLLPPGFTLP